MIHQKSCCKNCWFFSHREILVPYLLLWSYSTVARADFMILLNMYLVINVSIFSQDRMKTHFSRKNDPATFLKFGIYYTTHLTWYSCRFLRAPCPCDDFLNLCWCFTCQKFLQINNEQKQNYLLKSWSCFFISQ